MSLYEVAGNLRQRPWAMGFPEVHLLQPNADSSMIFSESKTGRVYFLFL